MYRVLLVDDEQMSLQALQRMLPWEQLGVSSVVMADSGARALELCEKFTVHLVVCDIEMPSMSGIELLGQIKQRWPAAEALILTCHADFRFAQEAIALGSLDYILKPVAPAEMQAAVEKALRTIAHKNTLEETSQKWEDSLDSRKQRFFLDVAQRTVLPRPESIAREAAIKGIDLPIERRYLPVLIHIQSWCSALPSEDKAVFQYGLKNAAQELLFQNGESGVLFTFSEQELLALLYVQQSSQYSSALLAGACSELSTACVQHLQCELACYVGAPCALEDLAAEAEALREYRNAKIAPPSSTLFIHAQNPQSQAAEPSPLQWEAWRELFEQGRGSNVVEQILAYLNKAAGAGLLDVLLLQNIQQDFMQLVYTALQKHELQAALLFQDRRSYLLSERALHSMERFAEWLRWVAQRSGEQLQNISETGHIVQQVKEYITLHINEDVNRESAAAAVYMNADHLSRLFKHKTGLSLSEYIVQERISLAKRLLTQTDMPVGDISMSLGYSSFSHFTKLFKSATGHTPIQYRKVWRS